MKICRMLKNRKGDIWSESVDHNRDAEERQLTRIRPVSPAP